MLAPLQAGTATTSGRRTVYLCSPAATQHQHGPLMMGYDAQATGPTCVVCGAWSAGVVSSGGATAAPSCDMVIAASVAQDAGVPAVGWTCAVVGCSASVDWSRVVVGCSTAAVWEDRRELQEGRGAQ
jgi:hypothetical protein